jgi:hypothetical protein
MSTKVDVSWDELERLVKGDDGLVQLLRKNAVAVLGAQRGATLLSALDRGETFEIVPSLAALAVGAGPP